MYCNKRRLGRSGRSLGIHTRFLNVLILAVLPEMGQTLAEKRNIQIRELKDDVKSAKGFFFGRESSYLMSQLIAHVRIRVCSSTTLLSGSQKQNDKTRATVSPLHDPHGFRGEYAAKVASKPVNVRGRTGRWPH
jgi:hypothetical protein